MYGSQGTAMYLSDAILISIVVAFAGLVGFSYLNPKRNRIRHRKASGEAYNGQSDRIDHDLSHTHGDGGDGGGGD
jgi:hypothetical protein